MARMIPSAIDPQTPSPGEREIFESLRTDPGTDGWTVLHSFFLPNHVRQIDGELDFVVMIPGKGVLCLEVKAVRSLTLKDGLWFYGQNTKGDARGPFRQASQGMHSLRERLRTRVPSTGKTPFWSGVVLPYVSVEIVPEEWHAWQLIDAKKFSASPFSVQCEHMIDSARNFLGSTPSAAWFDADAPVPTKQECEQMAHVLRPDFELFQSPKARRSEVAAEIKRYTEEQFDAIDAMDSNPRVVFQGPAGTGKTLLAIEAARRAVEEGQRVLLLCFNRLLGTWLQSEAGGDSEYQSVSTTHAYMLSVADAEVPQDADASFWEHELPQRAAEALLDGGSEGGYDLLIVDEAQDLLSDAYLDVFDLALAGGLRDGRWRFFGDFERQAIYGKGQQSPGEILLQRRTMAAQFRLGVNCRNTPRIATAVRLLSKLDDDYARILRPDNGIEPDLRFYSSSSQAPDALIEVLDELRSVGFRGEDVVVLSPLGSRSSAERVSSQPWRDRLKPLTAGVSKHTHFGTIHSFKGLEAPAIVVTDVEDILSQNAESLFYVALTRAFERLVILMDESVKADVATVLKGKGTPSAA